MNKTKFLQTDKRWGSLGYPKAPWYIRNCGCGEVSIANIIIEIEKYKNYTPATIQPYCKKYAAPNGNGTYFAGLPEMMEHYGLTEVKEHDTMGQLWKELKKGNRVAIYLMGSRPGGSKRVHWTSGGHLVCSVGYKNENKKHYVYVKDSYSNSRLRNGWISYEENMRNDVVRVWSGKLPAKAKKKAEPKKSVDVIAQEVIDGKWGNGDERVARLKAAGYDPDAVQKKVNEILAPKEPTWVDKANAWAVKMAKDSKAGYRKWSASDKSTHECLICHPETDPKHKWYPFTWNCIGESFAYWHHGGGLKCHCSCHVLDDGFMTKLLTMDKDEALKKLKKKIGLQDITLIRNHGKVIPQSKMKAGDLCITYDKNDKATHIYPYIGNGKMVDCGNWSDKEKQIAKRDASPCKAIIRYKGK